MKELDIFNEKYKGEEINYCDLLWKTINFNPEGLTFCCSSTLGYTPIMEPGGAETLYTFGKESFIKATIRLIEESQDDCKKGCYGCERLCKKVFTGIKYEDIRIKYLVWNHFRGCNSKCVYCGDGGKPLKVYYEPKTIVDRLAEENALAERVNVSFGGGEPTLVPNIKEYIEYGIKNGWEQFFNTNALHYKEYIANALTDANFSVQISVDAGTSEIYRKIKGQKGFEHVWDTIQRYAVTGGNIYLKYIVFSWNSSLTEIDAFMDRVVDCSKQINISVSGESSSGWGISNCEWEFGVQEIESCAYLMYRAFVNELAIYLYQGNFSKKDCYSILQVFIKKYLEPLIIDLPIYIWGMGMYGKALADVFIGCGVPVRAFGDGAVCKWGDSYCGIGCISLSEILKELGGRDAYVIIGVAEYREILDKLKQYANLKVRVINLM